MKKIIGFNEIETPERNGAPASSGYTVFYCDDEIEVSQGTWCGSQYVKKDNVKGVIDVGSEFDFSYKPSKDSMGKPCYRVSGMVIF